MDLSSIDVEASIGPINKIVTVEILGIVEPGDISALVNATTPAPQGANSGDLKRIKERHHAAARMLAQGMSQRMIAEICGYSETYLSTMLNTPSMQDLVAHYRGSHNAAADLIGEQLRAAGMGAVEKLLERLEADELENSELLGLAKLGLDRSGHGPQQKHHHLHESHVIDYAELTRLDREARRASQVDIIQVGPTSAPMLEDSSDG